MHPDPGSGGLGLSGEHGIFQGTMKHNLGGQDICRLSKALWQSVCRESERWESCESDKLLPSVIPGAVENAVQKLLAGCVEEELCLPPCLWSCSPVCHRAMYLL